MAVKAQSIYDEPLREELLAAVEKRVDTNLTRMYSYENFKETKIGEPTRSVFILDVGQQEYDIPDRLSQRERDELVRRYTAAGWEVELKETKFDLDFMTYGAPVGYQYELVLSTVRLEKTNPHLAGLEEFARSHGLTGDTAP